MKHKSGFLVCWIQNDFKSQKALFEAYLDEKDWCRVKRIYENFVDLVFNAKITLNFTESLEIEWH